MDPQLNRKGMKTHLPHAISITSWRVQLQQDRVTVETGYVSLALSCDTQAAASKPQVFLLAIASTGLYAMATLLDIIPCKMYCSFFTFELE